MASHSTSIWVLVIDPESRVRSSELLGAHLLEYIICLENPRAIVAAETDARIVRGGIRCRKQNERATRAELFSSVSNQITAHAFALNCLVNSEVRKVTAVIEVSDRAGHADK